MTKRGVRWTGEGLQSHYLSDLSAQQRGFIGSSVLIVHRPGVSHNILYQNFIPKAQNEYHSVVIFPLQEPHYLPHNLRSTPVPIDEIEKRRYKRGKIYRFQTQSLKDDKPFLDAFYYNTLLSKKRTYSFVIVLDTLKKWHPTLEEHIRMLLRESPLNNGSLLVHCPLAIVPPDLLSVFGNVMVVWPSKNEIDLLNEYFPAKPVPSLKKISDHDSQMLVFKSKPFQKRGWEWKDFIPSSPEQDNTTKKRLK